mmetsp:Transcript_46809/g.150420  ORF Transcript_46809/g.150420 Transcript_46809/m.150420 type:complete len:227 (-) Transcript_46809:628-1308(-)
MGSFATLERNATAESSSLVPILAPSTPSVVDPVPTVPVIVFIQAPVVVATTAAHVFVIRAPVVVPVLAAPSTSTPAISDPVAASTSTEAAIIVPISSSSADSISNPAISPSVAVTTPSTPGPTVILRTAPRGAIIASAAPVVTTLAASTPIIPVASAAVVPIIFSPRPSNRLDVLFSPLLCHRPHLKHVPGLGHLSLVTWAEVYCEFVAFALGDSSHSGAPACTIW